MCTADEGCSDIHVNYTKRNNKKRGNPGLSLSDRESYVDGKRRKKILPCL